MKPKSTTKLDFYSPDIIDQKESTVFIMRFDSLNSPMVADVSSEITASEGYIFASGSYYELDSMTTSNSITKEETILVVVANKIK